jgi:hypothetical protein
MAERKYELSIKGIKCAINDYVRNHWRELKFNGIGNHKVMGFEDVNVDVQGEFVGKSKYQFSGDARPIISDDNGGYTVNNMIISGAAHIIIDSNATKVESLSVPISIKKK